jgi:cytochrome c oxidase assembly protein subunit 15
MTAGATTTAPVPRAPLLPLESGRRVRAVAWASLAAEVLLVATGGAVRLTGSGLGCPTWPRCTAGSFVTTPAMGVHGVIEFGNRLLTGLLVIVAVVAFLAVVRMWRSRRDLFGLALAQLLSIPAQAVLGGITVLVKLNPWAVGAHFAFSLVLVVLMAVFVHRASTVPGARLSIVPPWFAWGAALAAALAAVTVVLGILTTGAGPHAGDAHSVRNGLDPVTLQEVHGAPAFGLAALTLVLLLAALRLGRLRLRLGILAALELAQIVVGVTQARLGLPPELVAVHLLLAACLVAATTAVVLGLRAPAAQRG